MAIEVFVNGICLGPSERAAFDFVGPRPLPPAQRILDEQGFLVFRSERKFAVGETAPGPFRCHGYAPMEAPMVVIAEATWTDMFWQALRFFGLCGEPDSGVWHYYKAIAE